MAASVSLVLGLLLWSSSGGSSSQTVFIQTKQDLLMTVTEEVDLGDPDIFDWKFNNKNKIVRLSANKPTTFSNYRDRVEFFSHNLSLLLKNVQLSDSGIYTAVVTGDKDTTCAEYEVTVQAPVSPVTVTVDSVSHSPESCNFTVSCTTDNIKMSHSFTCFHNQNCKKQEYSVITATSASLHLYLSNVSIICNHSNQVSWTKATWDVPRVCPTETAEEESVVSVCELKTAVFSVGLLLMVSAVISVHVMDCIKKKNV